MTKIKARKLTTIDVAAGEIYKVDLTTSSKIDIMNNTAGNLAISFDDKFEVSGSTKYYLDLKSGCAYNTLTCGIGVIYLKAEQDASVVLSIIS